MADVQTENGYTRIANDLLESILAASITHRQRTILLAIIRKTYGWGKKMDRISGAQIEKLTGIKRQHCSSEIKKLKKMNIIHSTKSGNIGVQKDYDLWASNSPKTGLVPKRDMSQNGYKTSPKTGLPSPKTVTKLVPKRDTQKKIKKLVQKKIKDSIRKKKSGFEKSGLKENTLPDKFFNYASTSGVQNIHNEWEHFCSHHLARGSKFLDWYRAWVTWCINSKKFNWTKSSKPKPGLNLDGTFDRFVDEIERRKKNGK